MKSNFVKPSKSFIRMAGLLAILSTAFQPGAVAEENPKTDAAEYVSGEIVVSSTRTDEKLKNIPRKVEVITSKDIEALNPADATELLKKTAGVDVIEYPGLLSGVSMRGFKPNYGSYYSAQYVTYLLDGRPLGTNNLSTVDMNMIDHVEVIKGPSSALYGSNGMAGTINFITKKSQGPIKGKVSAGYGSFGTYEGSATIGGSINDRMDFDLGVRYFNETEDYKFGKNTLIANPSSELLPDKNAKGNNTMENTAYSTNSESLRLGYRLSDNFRIDVRGSVFNAPSVHTAGDIFGSSSPGVKDVFRKTADLTLSGSVGNHSIKFLPYWSENESRNLKTDTSGETYAYYNGRNEEYGFQLQDAIKLGEHRLTAGIDYNTATYQTGRQSAPGVSIAPYSPDGKTANLGVFAESSLKLMGGKLVVTPGVRYDMTSFNMLETPLLSGVDTTKEQDSFFSPSLAFQYTFVPGLKTHASIGKAFVSPTALQKAGEYLDSYGYLWRGNSDLKPETSRTWDVGLTWSDEKHGLKADVTYYDTAWDDFITSKYVVDTTSYYTYVNAASAKLRGIEFEVGYDFGSSVDYRYSLRCFASYTHLFEATVTNTTGETPMTFVRNGLGSFGVEYDDFKFFIARLSARYLGSVYQTNYYKSYRPTLKDGVLEFDPSLVIDATVGFALNRQNRIDLTVQNLLDENYAEKDGYPMPGRSYNVRYTVAF